MSKDRHEIIKKMWQSLTNKEKFCYVIKSKIEEEKAQCKEKMAQIQDRIYEEFPEMAEL